MFKSRPIQHLRKLIFAGSSKLCRVSIRSMLKFRRVGEVAGVTISDVSLEEQHKDNFLSLTRQAMALIQSIDLRRYRRVCQRLDYIVNTPLISSGGFERSLKVCLMDYSKYTTSDSLINLRQYAGVLIHEATHGLLCEKGIPYNKQTRERVEQLCRLEEHRFASRFEPGYANDRVPPIDMEWYQRRWNGKTRGAELKRFWEAIKLGRLADKNAKNGVLIPPIPASAKAFNELGETSQREGYTSHALGYFNHAIQLDPKYARAYCNRGYAQHHNGNFDRALLDFNRSIQLDSKDARSFEKRSLAFRSKGEYDKAIADCDHAIQLDPQFFLAYNARGCAHRYKGEYDKAIADFDRTIQLEPKFAGAYCNRGFAYFCKADYDKAIFDCNRAIQLDPKLARAYQVRDKAYIQKGEKDRPSSGP